MTPREALAAMRSASAHHLLSSEEQAKLLAVAEAVIEFRDARAMDADASQRWFDGKTKLSERDSYTARVFECAAALDKAIASLASP